MNKMLINLNRQHVGIKNDLILYTFVTTASRLLNFPGKPGELFASKFLHLLFILEKSI